VSCTLAPSMTAPSGPPVVHADRLRGARFRSVGGIGPTVVAREARAACRSTLDAPHAQLAVATCSRPQDGSRRAGRSSCPANHRPDTRSAAPAAQRRLRGTRTTSPHHRRLLSHNSTRFRTAPLATTLRPMRSPLGGSATCGAGWAGGIDVGCLLRVAGPSSVGSWLASPDPAWEPGSRVHA
jgi:hypothetical protein